MGNKTHQNPTRNVCDLHKNIESKSQTFWLVCYIIISIFSWKTEAHKTYLTLSFGILVTLLFLIFIFLFLIYLLIMLLQLSHFRPFIQLHPAQPLPPTFPPYSSCPWVILISSLASTFPTLFLPSPFLFSTYHLCYFGGFWAEVWRYLTLVLKITLGVLLKGD